MPGNPTREGDVQMRQTVASGARRAELCNPQPKSVAVYEFGEGAWIWLGNLDSNQDKQSQSLLCYRYTIPQRNSRTNSRPY
jgi:hypothetical protein